MKNEKRISKIVENLPTGLRSFLKTTRSNLFRKSIIEKWVKNGSKSPPPHEVKQQTLIDYGKKYNCQTLVETGTFMGDMIQIQKNKFKFLYSIELSENLWKNAVKRFKNNQQIKILLGDSGVVLQSLVPTLKQKSLFWLDGHYSAGITAKGDLNCPIFNEFDAIFMNNKFEHIIIIDDAREFVGENDYPSIQEIENYLLQKYPTYKMEVKNDLIRITPKEN